MLKEFKEFAMKGNALDMAVGIILGAAFGTIVKSLVDDMIMPVVGMLLGGVDFTDFFIVLSSNADASGLTTLASAKAAGAVTINYGLFINAIISFLIVAFSVFLLVKNVNRLRGPAAPAEVTTKACAECCSQIPLKAKRCPHCTSKLE